MLEAALALAARLDRQVKGLSGMAPGLPRVDEPPPDPWDGLFQLAMTVAGAQGSPAAGSGTRGAAGARAAAFAAPRRPA